jgi:RNA polymerase sigma-70 factor (ECF subfamily)
MERSLYRTDEDIVKLYEAYKLTVYRVCFAYMKNTADTEDIVQEHSFNRLRLK